MSLRAVKQVLETRPTIEGAGVKLERAFGFGKTKEFDPFLLLDDFRNENPADYIAGFPWHPAPRHRDHHLCAGRRGGARRQPGQQGPHDRRRRAVDDGGKRDYAPGDAQRRRQGRMHGFQLWANLPAALKMTAPRYQDIPSSAIPEVTEDDGTQARLCAASSGARGTGGRRGRGPSDGYVDISVPPACGSGSRSRPAQCLRLCLCRFGNASATPQSLRPF